MKLRFWEREQEPRAGAPPAEVMLRAIGYVRNGRTQPRPHGWEKLESVVELLAEHEGRVEGLAAYSHIIVVFYMDLAEQAPEKPERLTLASGNTYGILATRSQLRPNHLGVSAVALVGVEGREVRVRGLDAIDGTPVLDLKPYLPEYDSIPGARVAGG